MATVPEDDNYIFIKFKSGADNDIQVSRGKDHFHGDNEPVASGSQTDTTTSPEKSWPSLLAESDSDSDREWSDDEVDHLNPGLNIQQRALRDLWADRDTDSFILQLLQDLDPMNLDLTTRHILNEGSEELLYPCNSKVKATCQVCFEEDIDTRERLCCKIVVCVPCLKEYLKTEVSQRNVRLQCLNCESYVHRDEILALLPNDLKEKYYQFLLEENKNPDIKTCPRCCFLQNKKDIVKNSTIPNKKKKKHKKSGHKVVCEKCTLSWCFDCHAPWHENIKCKEFRKGDKLVKNWAKEFSYGQKNAVKCPKCKVFIQKRSGCSHMTCSNCNTGFCYRCGHRYIQMKLIGKHSDRFSPFGCKYNLLPDKPVARKAVRGSVLGAKIFGGVLLGGLIVAAAAVFVGGSVIIVPAYFGVKYYSLRKRKKILRSYKACRTGQVMTQIAQATNTQNMETALRDVELGMSNHSDTMTSSESSSSNDHHGSTEVKVWVHSEDRDVDVGVKFKSQEQQTTTQHDNTVTTAEVTMEDDLVVLHVKTTSKLSEGEETVTEQEVEGIKNREEESGSTENSDALWEERNSDGNGCFVKILGKLPVKWEKEDDKDLKLKENLSIKPAIVKDKKKEEEKDGKVKERRKKIGTRRVRNHHDFTPESDNVEKGTDDFVLSEIQQVKKGTDDIVLSEIQQVKEICDIDPYMGVVSMETCDTVL